MYIELHSFVDTCANGVAACVYGVTCQTSGTNQGLIAARSRLAKQGLTIPQMEQVAGHMTVKFVANVRNALNGLPISSTHCWLDSSVALYRIRGRESTSSLLQIMSRRLAATKESPGSLFPQ